MTTETQIKHPTTNEIFNQFRDAVRNHNPHTLFEKAGIKWPFASNRTLYLAYGIIRGIPYRVMEPTAHPLFKKMGHSETVFLKNLSALLTYAGMPTTTEELKGWMAVPESEVRLALRTGRMEHDRAERAARRETHQKSRQANLAAVA